DDLGRNVEAAKIGEDAVDVASRVLDKSPSHMGAMRSRGLLTSALSRIYLFDLRPTRSLAMAQAATRDWENLVRADPGNSIAWNNLFVSRNWQGWALRSKGDPEAAIAVLKGSLEVAKRAPPSLNVSGGLGFNTVVRATWEADQGRLAEAQATLALSY